MTQVIGLLLATPAPPLDGVAVSWEGLTALGGVALAVATIFAMVFFFGQLTNKIETTEKAVVELAEQQKSDRKEARDDNQKLGAKVDGMVSAVGQLQGEIKRAFRKRGDDD